jgi:hypothetical protein
VAPLRRWTRSPATLSVLPPATLTRAPLSTLSVLAGERCQPLAILRSGSSRLAGRCHRRRFLKVRLPAFVSPRGAAHPGP